MATSRDSDEAKHLPDWTVELVHLFHVCAGCVVAAAGYKDGCRPTSRETFVGCAKRLAEAMT